MKLIIDAEPVVERAYNVATRGLVTSYFRCVRQGERLVVIVRQLCIRTKPEELPEGTIVYPNTEAYTRDFCTPRGLNPPSFPETLPFVGGLWKRGTQAIGKALSKAEEAIAGKYNGYGSLLWMATYSSEPEAGERKLDITCYELREREEDKDT